MSNLSEKMRDAGVNAAELARRVETTRQQIGRLKNGQRRMTKEWAERIAPHLDCSPAELLFEGETTVAKIPAPTDGTQIPVFASAQAGPDGMTIDSDPIDYTPSPPQLLGVKAAFAVYVVNDSMEPKYRQGDMLWIDPSRPAIQNDYVLIELAPEDGERRALVKQLVKFNAEELVVKQYNPATEVEIDVSTVVRVWLIAGNLERRG